MRPTGTAEELERRRRRAIVLLNEGHGVRATAEMVGASPGTVTKWRQVYEARGDPGLCAKPHPGGTAKLTTRQFQRLERLLLQGPGRHGYSTELWTLPRIAEVVRKHFGVTYDPSGVWHVLNRMRWSCQKPERRARERDEERIEHWRKTDWPRIKKSAKTRP
jgi:transposase